MSDDEIPESDRVPGAPHPRMTREVIGQDKAIHDFLDATRAGRLHHAWLITGPRGVGKATLAWSIARWLLAGADGADLSLPPDDPITRRVAALSEPRLHLVRRGFDEKSGRLRAEITVDETRKLQSFFHLSATDGGHRVAIIDAVDEMNISAANALLKLLEEPPQGAVLLLVAHQPARLLPTIRSRCRELRLSPLSPADMGRALDNLGAEGDSDRLSALAAGSVGEALRLQGQGGLELYQRITDLFATLPRMDRGLAGKLADRAGQRATADGDPFDLFITLADRFLSRLSRAALLGPPLPEAAQGEGALMARLAPDQAAARQWAEAAAQLSARARAGRAVNLDPSALVMDMLIQLAGSAPAHPAH